jgi:c(7)-type cytochrome triheme protein
MSRRLVYLIPLLFLILYAGEIKAGGHGEAKKESESARVVKKFSPIVGVYWVKESPPTVLSREEALSALPCFKCHSLEAFMGEPKPGVFSHELHSAFDIHCNQCHEVRGHKRPQVIAGTCNSCHSLKKLIYRGGGMGRVPFNHEFHSMAFSCGDCHTGLFLMKKGSTRMRMTDMYNGKSCGSCHNGRLAFPSTDCMKCHKG